MGKYLITGGCGFIGSHLVENLLNLGHEIRVIDDLSTGKRENIPSTVEFIEASITDKESLKKALDDVEGCFHLAAVASVERSTKEWSKTHLINQTSTIYLFEEILSLPKPIFVIYASSASVYGNCTHFPLNENEKTAPISAYGADKLGCELHAHVAWHLNKIPSVGLRFFNVYGSRQDPLSPYSGVITKFINKILNNESLEIFGDGNQQRDFVHVKDVIACILGSMNSLTGAEVYNICTGRSHSIKQLVQFIQEIFDIKVTINYSKARQGDPLLSVGDPSKFEKQFGFKPEISLKDGLATLVHALK